jgi:DNA-binding transcriptional MerR regulator
MKIGELARQSGVAATALRYYEKAGLLPASRRTSSGYRTYDRDVVSRLAFIRAAQAVGLSVAEIRDVIGIRDAGAAPCTHVLQLIERHREEVQSRIRELQELERDLSRLTEYGAGVDPSECDAAGICQVIPSEAALVPRRPRNSRTAMLIASASNQTG